MSREEAIAEFRKMFPLASHQFIEELKQLSTSALIELVERQKEYHDRVKEEAIDSMRHLQE